MKNFKTIRDILDYAIEKEAEANSFYNHLAQDVEKAELRAELENFAVDELQHKLRLEAVRDGRIELTEEEIGSLHIAESIDDVKLRRNMSPKELLAYAIKQEDAAQRLYSQMAQLAKQDDVKELFTLLAQEEAQHKLNLEIEYDLATF
jgi:rubrerythrin